MGWPPKITIWVITMTECQRVHTVMILVVGIAVVEEAPDTASLCFSESAIHSWQQHHALIVLFLRMCPQQGPTHQTVQLYRYSTSRSCLALLWRTISADSRLLVQGPLLETRSPLSIPTAIPLLPIVSLSLLYRLRMIVPVVLPYRASLVARIRWGQNDLV